MVRTMTSDKIVGLLLKQQPVPVDEARIAVPPEPGFYAWWVSPEALPEVPKQPQPTHGLDLLYVGIAPSRATSSRSLRTRICGQHIGGNSASSTFRFGLAAMLWRREGWEAVRSGSGKVRLSPTSNKRLSEWQLANLQVAWAVVEDPWRFEREVIQLMSPPMNGEFNQGHPFYTAIGAAPRRAAEGGKAGIAET